MNATLRKINSWIRDATRADIEELLSKIILTERQNKIFEMYYIAGQSVGFIADTLGVCQLVISKELRRIREKMLKSGIVMD